MPESPPPSRPGTGPTTGGARALRFLAGILGAVLLVLLVLWVAAPWLAPIAAQRTLPEGWSVEALALERPGPTHTLLESGRFTGRVAGLDITVDVDQLTWRYTGPTVHANAVRVTALPVVGDDSAPPLRFEDISLPRIVLPSAEVAVEVAHLAWRYGEGAEAISGSLEQLRLDGTADELSLGADLAPNALLRAPSRLSLDWSAGTFQLAWQVTDQSVSSGLRIEQAAREGSDPLVDGLVEVDLNLSSLNPASLATLARALGVSAFTAASGRVRARIALEGVGSLAPVQAEVALDDAHVANAETRLDAGLDVSIRMEGGNPVARVARLEFESEGPLPRVNEFLAGSVDAPHITGFDPGAPFFLGVTAPLESDESLEIRWSRDGMAPDSVSGSLRLDAILDGATRLSAETPRLAWVAGGDAGTLKVETLDLHLRRDSTLLVPLDDGAIGFSAGEFHIVGDFEDSGSGTGFTGRLVVAEFSDFSVSQPAATARLRTLGLSGTLEVGDDLRFEGPVGAAGLVVAPVDAVAASSLLTADSLAFEVIARGLGVTELSGRGRLNGVALPDLGAQADGVDLELASLALPAVSGGVSGLTSGLEITLGDTRYQGLDLELRGDLAEGRMLEGEGSLLLGFTGELPFRYRADLRSPALEASLSGARLGAGALPDAARALAISLPQTLAFRGGELVLDGRITYADGALAGALDLQGDALELGLGESRFEGLDFSTRVDVAEAISGRGPLALEFANLAAGLDLTALSTSVEFENADFGLLSLDARLLGGQVRTPALKLVGGQLQGTLVEWVGFDLAQLLTFVDVGGLSGSGTLDARIPIVNDGSGPAVEAGHFAARGPGVLRYQSGAPATNIGLQALENFQYDSLEGQLDYDSDGTYTIALDLLGRNPDLYGGHPVRFRLNLGGVMPALFRSLFITGDFDKAIIERLRAGEPALPESTESPSGPD